MHAGDVKVVGIFRSEESVKKVSEIGNPAEDKYVTVVGSVGEWWWKLSWLDLVLVLIYWFHPASEKDAADLQKRVLEKVGSYTDVVATVGGFSFAKTLLEFSAEEIKTVSNWRKHAQY